MADPNVPGIRFDPSGFGPAPAAGPGTVTLDPNALNKAASSEGGVSRLAAIVAQRGGEGLATSVPSIIDLLGMAGTPEMNPNTARKFGGVQQRPGGLDVGAAEATRNVYRSLFGHTKPEGAVEKVAGNVAEMAGGAVIPAAAEATLAKTSTTAALEASHYLRTLASMKPTEIAKVQAVIAGGAGLGKSAGEAVSDNPLVQFATTLAGAFTASGALRLIEMARSGIASRFSQKGAETNVGKTLDELVPAGSKFEANLNESIALADKTGVKPTLAAATQSPGVAAAENTISKVPGVAERAATQRVSSSDAVRSGLEAEMKPPVAASAPAGNLHETMAAGVQSQVDAVNAEAQRLQAEVGGYVERATKSMTDVVNNVTKGTATKEEAGQALRDAVQAREAEVVESANALYKGLGDAQLPAGDLAGVVKGVIEESKGSIREGLVPAPIKNLAAKLSGGQVTPEQQAVIAKVAGSLGITPDAFMADPKYARILEDLGVKSVPDVSFTELRRWRSDIHAEIRANVEGASPDRQVVRNLTKIADALDATIDQASELSPAYRAANDAYRSLVERFRQGVVAEVTRVKPNGEQAVALEDVAGKFLKGGGAQGQVASARDFVNAVGDVGTARKALRDYAVRDFLGSAYQDGALNAKRATTWIESHADALTQFPEIRTELEGIAKQAKRLSDVEGFVGGAKTMIEQNAKRSVDEIERSAAAAYTKADPATAMDTVLRGDNPAKRMADLTRAAGADPQAMNGLRRAFFDHMERTVAPTDPMFNNPLMDPKKLRDFITANEGPMRVLYTPEQIGNIKTLARATELSMDPAAARGMSVAGKAVAPEQAYSAQQVVARLYTMARWTSTGYVVSDFFARKTLALMGMVEKDQLLNAWERAMFDPKAAKVFIEMGRKDFDPKHVATMIRQLGPTMVTPTAQAATGRQQAE